MEGWQNILMYVFFVIFVVCLIMAAMSTRNPKYAFICKVPTKLNGFMSWIALAILAAVAVSWTAPKDEYGHVIIPPQEETQAVDQQP